MTEREDERALSVSVELSSQAIRDLDDISLVDGKKFDEVISDGVDFYIEKRRADPTLPSKIAAVRKEAQGPAKTTPPNAEPALSPEGLRADRLRMFGNTLAARLIVSDMSLGDRVLNKVLSIAEEVAEHAYDYGVGDGRTSEHESPSEHEE